MNAESAPWGASRISAVQRDQLESYTPAIEAACRIDAAEVVLVAAIIGNLDHEIAERGALALLGSAQRQLASVAS